MLHKAAYLPGVKVTLEEKCEEKQLGQEQCRDPSRILYHGSCSFYVAQQIIRFPGSASHDVFLTISPLNAVGYALQRAKQYIDCPTLVIYDTQKSNDKFEKSWRKEEEILRFSNRISI